MNTGKREATRLTKKFQTTIPKEIRKQKGLQPGDKLVWILNPDGSIQLEKTVDDAALERFIGICRTNLGTEEIIEQMRGPRNEDRS